MNLFVNVGEDAKSAYDEYERIKSIEDPFKRKKEFLKNKDQIASKRLSIMFAKLKRDYYLYLQNKNLSSEEVIREYNEQKYQDKIIELILKCNDDEVEKEERLIKKLNSKLICGFKIYQFHFFK